MTKKERAAREEKARAMIMKRRNEWYDAVNSPQAPVSTQQVATAEKRHRRAIDTLIRVVRHEERAKHPTCDQCRGKRGAP